MMLNKKTPTIERLLFLAVFIMAVSLFALRFILALSYLPETGGVSINVLYGIIRIMHGSDLYTNPELPPFPIIQYTPLHFYFIKSISYLAGQEDNIHGVMVINRIVCLFTDLLCVFFLAKSLIRLYTMKPLFSWLLAFIYFVCIPGIIYGRGDNLYLLFFTLTVISLLQGFSVNENRFFKKDSIPLLTGITTALALSTKQTGIFLLVLCFSCFLIQGNTIRSLIRYSAAVVVVTLIIFLATSPATSLAEMKLNIVDGVKNGINANWFLEVFLKNYFLKFSYLLAGGLVIAILLVRMNNDKESRFIGIGILWYFFVAVLSSFKAGSGPNYYLEFLILSLFGLALLIKDQKISYENNLLFALILTPFFLVASANDKGWGDTKLMKAAKEDYFNSEEVAAYLLPKLKKDQWVLTNFHKKSAINLQLSDKALFPCREVALYFTRPIGVFHFNEFSQMINTPKIPYIVDRKNKFPDVFLDDSLLNYAADTTIGNYSVYKLITEAD